MHINDFPDGILANAARYLAAPSAVMFSIAVTQDGTSSNQFKHTQTSNAIISAAASTSNNNNNEQQLQALDFGDIEKSLAARLSDYHITIILNHIDAQNNLKSLKLAGCVNITGSCLEYICSSVVLVELDLSLVRKHESPILDTEPLLSESVIIPILDDILDVMIGTILGGLKLLHLPKAFKTN